MFIFEEGFIWDMPGSAPGLLLTLISVFPAVPRVSCS